MRGATLLALAAGRYVDAETRPKQNDSCATLEQRGVESRRVVQDLQALDSKREEENQGRD